MYDIEKSHHWFKTNCSLVISRFVYSALYWLGQRAGR